MTFEAPGYSSEGVRKFFEFITDDDVHQAFLRGSYQVLLAERNGEMVGVASIRSGNRLSLLFVKEEYHRQGIGSLLLEYLCAYMRQEQGEETMVVYAAPYAVNFYRRKGFVFTGACKEMDGILVTPMEKWL